ncbi:MAG: YdbH domain-containing protein [Pseudomonadales bacterium]|nr:YdbH domain-containing protein [Pseudomonadales bacterium]
MKRIAQQIMLGLTSITVICAIIAFYRLSDISSAVANRILPAYGIQHTNIKIGQLNANHCIIDEVTMIGTRKGTIDTDSEFTYRVRIQNGKLNYDISTLRRDRLRSVEIEKIVVTIQQINLTSKQNNQTNPPSQKQPTSSDSVAIATLLIEHWRSLLPFDELTINDIELNFENEQLSVALTNIPILKLKGNIELDSDTLRSVTTLHINDQPPLSLMLKNKKKEGLHFELSQSASKVLTLRLEPTEHASSSEPNQYLISGGADLGFIDKVLDTNNWIPEYPQDLSISGQAKISGQISLPTFVEDISSDTLAWTGNSVFDLNASLVSEGIDRFESKGQMDLHWNKGDFTAVCVQPLAYRFEPVWSYFNPDETMLPALDLTNRSTISGTVFGGAEVEISNNSSFIFRSKKRVEILLTDPSTGSHYTASFKNISVHYLEEFNLLGNFDFEGTYDTLELPLSSVEIDLKQTSSQLAMSFTHHWTQFDGDMTTHFLMPFDSNQISLNSTGSLRNLPNLQHYVSSITPISNALKTLSGTLLFAISFQGSEDIASPSDIESLDKNFSLTLNDLSFSYDDILVKGINGRWLLSGTHVMNTNEPATLSVDSIDIGFPITDLNINSTSLFDFKRYYINDEMNLTFDVSLFDAQLLGGEIYNFKPFTINAIDSTSSLVLKAKNLQLTKILALNQLENLEGTGSLNGTFPVLINEQGIEIHNGKLKSIAPGGEIRYSLDEANKAFVSQQAGLNLATDILENFHYSELDIVANFSPKGQTHLKNHFFGHNPDKYQGTPINLNLNVELNVLKMIRSLQLSNDISDNIENRFSDK